MERRREKYPGSQQEGVARCLRTDAIRLQELSRQTNTGDVLAWRDIYIENTGGGQISTLTILLATYITEQPNFKGGL